MSTYFAILTEVGEAKLANAIALGQTLKLKTLAVGDGNGVLPMPVRTQKALVHEVRRAGLNQLTVDPANASQIIVEQVLPEDVGGWWIREIGIFDEAGDLCAVANCAPSYKPLLAEGSGRTQVVRIVLIVASTAAIELKIDPSIILATRKYVDDQDITVRAYSDQQLAKHLASADPHPLLAKIAYVDQKDTAARAYGDQQLSKHQAATDPHPLLAKITYVDQQDAAARTYGDQQLAKHQAATDPHPLLAKITYVDQQDTAARTYGDQQLAKHQAATDPHPLLAKITYVDQQDAAARTYGDQQLAKHQAATEPHPLLAKITYVDLQDAAARTYGDQRLARHQSDADPHPQYSMKEVPTQPRFDASTKLANTAFVQQAKGSMVGFSRYSDSRTLTAGDIGCVLLFGDVPATLALPLPSSLGIPENSGACVLVAVTGSYAVNVVPGGAGAILYATDITDKLIVKKGQSVTLMATAGNIWRAVDSTAEMWRNEDFANYFNNVAPTPEQFNNSNRIATTEFVIKARGNRSGTTVVTGNLALSAAHVGQTMQLFGATPGAITLPPSASIDVGSTVELWSNATATFTLYPHGKDIISTGTVTPSTIAVATGDTITLVYKGAGAWLVTAGALQLGASSTAFGASMGVNGYQKLPSGLIIQRGVFAANKSADTPIVFPIAFPNEFLMAVVSGVCAGSGAWGGYNNATRVGMNGNFWATASTREVGSATYIAYGR